MGHRRAVGQDEVAFFTKWQGNKEKKTNDLKAAAKASWRSDPPKVGGVFFPPDPQIWRKSHKTDLAEEPQKKPLRYRVYFDRVLNGYYESSDRRRQKAEPLRDWRRSSVLLHMLLDDLGQRVKLVPLPE